MDGCWRLARVELLLSCMLHGPSIGPPLVKRDLGEADLAYELGSRFVAVEWMALHLAQRKKLMVLVFLMKCCISNASDLPDRLVKFLLPCLRLCSFNNLSNVRT